MVESSAPNRRQRAAMLARSISAVKGCVVDEDELNRTRELFRHHQWDKSECTITMIPLIPFILLYRNIIQITSEVPAVLIDFTKSTSSTFQSP